MTVTNGMRPVHPGEILRDELQALGLSANALSKALDVPVNRITAILHGQRGVTADTALRLARYFGTTPQVWLNLQKTYELRRAEPDIFDFRGVADLLLQESQHLIGVCHVGLSGEEVVASPIGRFSRRERRRDR